MQSGTFHRIVWPLAIAETIIWAGMFYSFAALLVHFEADFGWSKPQLTSAFTAAILASAALAPFAGRIIDLGFGRALMCISALAGAGLLCLLTLVGSAVQFFVVWTGLGIAMAGCLYEPCFAILTRSLASQARRAITAVSLVAGFAGTVSFPTAHYFAALLGWRGAILVFAGAIVCIAVPLLLYAMAHTRILPHQSDGQPSGQRGSAMRTARQSRFWLLGLAFAFLAIDHGMILTHILPLLDERGLSADLAVVAASFIGPMQVVGRIIVMRLEHAVSSIAIGIACQVSISLAALALAGVSAVPVLIVAFVFFQGFGNGVTSIMRPVLTAELLGRADFGLVSGMIAVGFMTGFAVGPTLGSYAWRAGGYDLMLALAVVLGLAGAAMLRLAARTPAPTRTLQP